MSSINKMENNDITLKDKLNRMFFKENNETYSLKIITDWLKQKNMKDMKDMKFIYNSAPVDRYGMYQHGIKISFPTFGLSIQTHPMVAGWAFAETLKTNDMSNEVRHATPDKLFEYIEDLSKAEVLQE